MQTFISTAVVTAGQHWEGGGPPAFWPIFPIAWFLIVVAVIAAVYVGAKRRSEQAGRRAGEARLAERYADGQIDDEEYRARLAVLRQK